jgi:hypothetical protein
MERISRYILVVVAIVTVSVALPKLYWMAFEKPAKVPFVLYSCTDQTFMILRAGQENSREDAKGNQYTREEYEQKLPLMYMRQLIINEKMPDTINGVAMDLHEINRTNSYFRFVPGDMNGPKPRLYPLFESESGRANLELPDDYFRINWRIEFVEASTNQVLEEKSRMFSAALYKKGFIFPAELISGIPTTRKSCDEGYLLQDHAGQLFHLKMIHGKPYVVKVDLPEGLHFKFIGCVDFRDKYFYAYLFSDQDEIYVLTQDDYQLIKLPVEGFHPETCSLKIHGDLFNYHVVIEAEDHMQVQALDRQFKKIDNYNECWVKRAESSEGKIFAAIFPWQISMTNGNSCFIRFYGTMSAGMNWLVLNLLFAVLHFTLTRREKRYSKILFADHLIVAVAGIFGLIAVLVFPASFYK